jgi:hypothetical protein
MSGIRSVTKSECHFIHGLKNTVCFMHTPDFVLLLIFLKWIFLHLKITHSDIQTPSFNFLM